jgi:hypothetical protein
MSSLSVSQLDEIKALLAQQEAEAPTAVAEVVETDPEAPATVAGEVDLNL